MVFTEEEKEMNDVVFDCTVYTTLQSICNIDKEEPSMEPFKEPAGECFPALCIAGDGTQTGITGQWNLFQPQMDGQNVSRGMRLLL